MDIIIVIIAIISVISIACSILDDSDDNTKRYGHHDSRPGSHYEISNRK